MPMILSTIARSVRGGYAWWIYGTHTVFSWDAEVRCLQKPMDRSRFGGHGWIVALVDREIGYGFNAAELH